MGAPEIAIASGGLGIAQGIAGASAARGQARQQYRSTLRNYNLATAQMEQQNADQQRGLGYEYRQLSSELRVLGGSTGTAGSVTSRDLQTAQFARAAQEAEAINNNTRASQIRLLSETENQLEAIRTNAGNNIVASAVGGLQAGLQLYSGMQQLSVSSGLNIPDNTPEPMMGPPEPMWQGPLRIQ